MNVVWAGPAKVEREVLVARAGRAAVECACAVECNAAIAELLGHP